MRSIPKWIIVLGLMIGIGGRAESLQPELALGESSERSYEKGVSYAEARDLASAVKWLSVAAENGHLAALHRLGLIYFVENPEIPRDSTKAVELWRKAAEQGFPPAQCDLAWALLKGDGVDQDTEQGMAWLVKSAQAGHAAAMFALGDMFLRGQPVSQDKRKAFALFERAAYLEHSGAQYNAAAMLWMGDGVTKDPIRAYAWLLIGAESGETDIVEYKDRISKRLTSDQIADALIISSKMGRQIRAMKNKVKL